MKVTDEQLNRILGTYVRIAINRINKEKTEVNNESISIYREQQSING